MPTKKTIEKADYALALMKKMGLGLDDARRIARVSVKVLKRIMDDRGIKYKRSGGKGRSIILKRSLDEKAKMLIELMLDGVSASKGCKKLNTALKTMIKRTIGGEPIIKKVGKRWKSNVIRISEYSVVAYGKLESNLGNAISGSTPLQHPRHIDDGKLDQRYGSIQWQYDIDKFRTTLPANKVGDFYRDRIFNFLQGELTGKTSNISFPLLQGIVKQPSGYVNKFLQGIDPKVLNKVRSGIIPSGGIGLNMLEQIFNQMGVELSEDGYILGVDPDANMDAILDRRVKYMTIAEFNKISVVTDKGLFGIMVWRKGGTSYSYPDVPLELFYEHDLKDELSTNRDIQTDNMFT